jgi:hypothetical protein
MNEEKTVYTNAELKALGAVNENMYFGPGKNMPKWQLGSIFLIFNVICFIIVIFKIMY